MIAPILSALSGMVPGLLNRAGDAVGKKIQSKIEGFPSVDAVQTDPLQMGQDFSKYMDGAFPGTNSWDRLGQQSSYGAIESVNKQNQQQNRMQKNELQNRKEIAEMNNLASVVSAASPQGARAAVELGEYVMSRGQKKPQEFDTSISIQKDKLPYEVAELDTRSKEQIAKASESVVKAELTKNQNTIEKARAEWADVMAELDLTNSQTKSIQGMIANYVKGFSDRQQQHEAEVENIWRKNREQEEEYRNFIQNKGPKPNRFKKVV